ncbi:DNA-directed RNA polymerase II subunit RPB2-like [Homarus americanus]|uniref:DNA-directed RNA polymerase II subunit RPB2-like n=1 Tax=Homarus americanus TaxID=6706 RepID=UPI001C45000A|nr:DNA-directed RNA polymerase II subunit RPB2-like [Homarus americanus]
MPLVYPAEMRRLPNFQYLYSGQVMNVAVMPIFGYNQEDGLVFSQGAIDRGAFTSLHYYTYRKVWDSNEDGEVKLAQRGTVVSEGDIVILCSKSDSVKIPKGRKPGKIVSTYFACLPDGKMTYEVRVEVTLHPEVGDKFAPLCGQKGVICAIIPDEQLPRTADGLVPDIFMNPHGFIDRQTVSFHVEGMLGLLAKKTGCQIEVKKNTPYLKLVTDAGIESC